MGSLLAAVQGEVEKDKTNTPLAGRATGYCEIDEVGQQDNETSLCTVSASVFLIFFYFVSLPPLLFSSLSFSLSS